MQSRCFVKALKRVRSYAAADGTGQEAVGELTASQAISVTGSFSYPSPEGQVQVKYVADEFGFQPTGAHIHPAILEAVRRQVSGPWRKEKTQERSKNSFSFLRSSSCTALDFPLQAQVLLLLPTGGTGQIGATQLVQRGRVPRQRPDGPGVTAGGGGAGARVASAAAPAAALWAGPTLSPVGVSTALAQAARRHDQRHQPLGLGQPRPCPRAI